MRNQNGLIFNLRVSEVGHRLFEDPDNGERNAADLECLPHSRVMLPTGREQTSP